MQQLLTVVLWTVVEFLVLKTWSRVAPQSFAAFLAKLFPPAS